MTIKYKKQWKDAGSHRNVAPKPLVTVQSGIRDEGAPALCNASPEDRIRLSCDITRGHHRKLKVYAAESCKTIVDVVESFIDQHCRNTP